MVLDQMARGMLEKYIDRVIIIVKRMREVKDAIFKAG